MLDVPPMVVACPSCWLSTRIGIAMTHGIATCWSEKGCWSASGTSLTSSLAEKHSLRLMAWGSCTIHLLWVRVLCPMVLGWRIEYICTTHTHTLNPVSSLRVWFNHRNVSRYGPWILWSTLPVSSWGSAFLRTVCLCLPSNLSSTLSCLLYLLQGLWQSCTTVRLGVRSQDTHTLLLKVLPQCLNQICSHLIKDYVSTEKHIHHTYSTFDPTQDRHTQTTTVSPQQMVADSTLDFAAHSVP